MRRTLMFPAALAAAALLAVPALAATSSVKVGDDYFVKDGAKPKVTVAKGDIKAIAAALDMYKLDNFAYPSTQQGLEALVKKPTGNPQPKNWNKDGYLKKLPVDPWGNPYQYLAPGTKGPFDLYSLGADGKEGGSDNDADIGNWDN